MTAVDKLKEKLKRGSINARELRSLLNKEGWMLDHTKGSHESWSKKDKRFILATHGQGLKPYQIKQAQKVLL